MTKLIRWYCTQAIIRKDKYRLRLPFYVYENASLNYPVSALLDDFLKTQRDKDTP